jgi:hypothetical protein
LCFGSCLRFFNLFNVIILSKCRVYGFYFETYENFLHQIFASKSCCIHDIFCSFEVNFYFFLLRCVYKPIPLFINPHTTLFPLKFSTNIFEQEIVMQRLQKNFFKCIVMLKVSLCTSIYFSTFSFFLSNRCFKSVFWYKTSR